MPTTHADALTARSREKMTSPRPIFPRPTSPDQSERSAIAYTRVSREEQVRNGVSLEAQRARVVAYAQAKDLTLQTVYTDEGISGKDLDRPGLRQLFARCATGQVGHVIIWKLDRLTRCTRHLLGLVEDLFLASQIEMHSVSESLDTSTPHGRFVLTLLGGLAQMERELIAERTRAALAWKRSNGLPTSHAPLGFRSVGKRAQMEPVIEELDIVRRILALREAGRSYRGIATALNTEGVWTKRRTLWHHSTVAKIVTARDRYIAVLGPGGEGSDTWKTPATPERACPPWSRPLDLSTVFSQSARTQIIERSSGTPPLTPLNPSVAVCEVTAYPKERYNQGPPPPSPICTRPPADSEPYPPPPGAL